MRPAVPGPLRPTIALYAAMLAGSLANLALVEDDATQMLVAVSLIMGGAVILIVQQRLQARRLNVRTSADLPQLPLPARLIPAAIGIPLVIALVTTDKLYSGWWALVMLVIFGLDDLNRRRAFAPVLRGEHTARRPPPSLAKLVLALLIAFCGQVALFGWLTLSPGEEPVTVGGIVETGLLFGLLMTAFFAAGSLLDRRRIKQQTSAESGPSAEG